MGDTRKHVREWKSRSKVICKVCDGPKDPKDHHCFVCATWLKGVYAKHRKAIALHFYKEREFNAQ